MSSTLKEELVPSDEDLYRQVSPSSAWLDNGRVTSVAFTPWEKDDGLLSVYCGSKTSAEGSYDHYTKTLGLSSAGSWAVTTEEVAQVGMKSWWSPVEPPDPLPNPAHGSIDFRGLDKKATKTRAKALAAKAHARGRKHPTLEQGQPAAPPPASAAPATQPGTSA
jgi:hypothetical protein